MAVPAGDEHALLAALNAAVQQLDLQRERAVTAAVSVRSRYAMNEMIRQYTALFTRLANERSVSI